VRARIVIMAAVQLDLLLLKRFDSFDALEVALNLKLFEASIEIPWWFCWCLCFVTTGTQLTLSAFWRIEKRRKDVGTRLAALDRRRKIEMAEGQTDTSICFGFYESTVVFLAVRDLIRFDSFDCRLARSIECPNATNAFSSLIDRRDVFCSFSFVL
jgi:hypothetical protein